MDFNELRQLQISERNSSLPQEVSNELYSEMDELLAEENNLNLIRSINVVANEIKRLRFNKIINNAKHIVETNNERELLNLTEEETEFYKKCVSLFRSWYQ